MEPLFLYLLTMPAAGSCLAKGCVFVQNDNLKRFFCFLLCFVLLISCIPRPAHAVGVDWILRQIGTDIGITGILQGLGLFRDTLNGDEYYNDLVSDVKDHLAITGQVAGDYIDAYWRIDPLNANPVLTIPLALISAVRNYIFDNGVVSDNTVFPPSDSSLTFKDAWTVASNQPYAFTVRYFDNSLGLYYSSVQLVFSDGEVTTKDFSDSIFYFNGSIFTNIGYKLKFGSSGSVESIFGTSVPSVSTDKNISLGLIVPPGTMFTSAYPLWLEHERQLEDGTTETVVQIGLGNTQAETESLTQEQIWSGLGTIQIPDQDQTQGALLDILQSIVQLPTQIVGSIQTALQSFFQISGEATDYAIQLRDFFPFCIPFDLFDFITVLSAEPEAPVFHWEIPVPQMGQTFELEVDLSAWDDIAVLFRNLELLAFIFGLAIMTREKFLRS